MSTIGEVRTELADAIRAQGLRCNPYQKSKVAAPEVLMGAGPNFLTIPDEQTFGGRVVEINMYLTLVSGKTDQTEGLKYLDQMLDKVLPQCLDLGWEFSVEPPFIDTFDDKAYVACNIAVSNTFELED